MNALTTALTGMRRSPYQTLAAIVMMTITFFVAYTFSLFVVGAEYILRYFETQPQVTAFFEIQASQEQIEQAQQTMTAKPYVEQVEIVSKEKALELYQQDNRQDPLLLELVTADILPASIEVSAKSPADLPQIKTDLEQVAGIDEVVFQQDVMEALTRWTSGIRLAGIASTILLALSSVLILFVVIGIKVTHKKQMITIMRIIGATRWYIAQPFFFEGILYGLIGSLVGWSAMYALLLYLTPWLRDFVGSIQILPVSWYILAIQLSIGSVAGMVLGGLTGTMAVRRQLRRTI